jgi:uncharacterized membrane protein YsdA (DUF1294 family)
MSTSTRRQSPYTTYSVAALIALVVLGILLYFWLEWALYWVWLIVVNVVTFAFFRFDKARAQTPDAGRVPEVVLLTLMWVGGVLGGAAGMYMRPRHKTHKPIFVITLWAALALHAYLFYRWLSL